LNYGITGDPDLVHLRDVLTNQISPVIESASGVAQVTIAGGYDRSIIVNVDPDKLQSFGITMLDVSTRLKEENISLPAGTAKQETPSTTFAASATSTARARSR